MKGVISLPAEQLNGSNLNILIVHARWNTDVISPLVTGCTETLVNRYKVQPKNITTISVPGSFELPMAVSKLIKNGKYDAAIAIGVLIKGSTMHFEYISDAVSHGLMRIGLDTNVPVIFGVLTCLTEEQALERAGVGKGENKGHNHGIDWAAAAVEMALL